MIVVKCPCYNSNNVDFDKDEYGLNTSSCTYFKDVIIVVLSLKNLKQNMKKVREEC